jgi:hypothetical protein
MNETPPLPDPAQKRDMDHLNLLAIFHFVGAGLAALGLFIPAGALRDDARDLYQSQIL